MSVTVRPALASLPVYRPGRTPEDIARELGLPAAVKLASNEAPDGPLPSVAAAIAAAVPELNRYPDFHKRALCDAVAARHGVDPAQVTASAGSVALLGHLLAAVAGPGDEVVFAWRSFEAYPGLVTVSGARPVRVSLEDFHHDLVGLAAAVTPATRAVIVCNPNNPTGTVVGGDLASFVDAMPPDVLVVLDEAYREYIVDPSVPDGVELARGRDNVAVLRTFSKAYGLAGLRVGYCVSSPTFAETLRKVQLSFGVNSLAQAAALASLAPAASAELASRVASTVAERMRVSEALAGLGFVVPPSQANFVYLPLGSDAADFTAACEAQGVIVRGFPGDGVRVSIGSPADNNRFLAAARSAVG